MPPRRLPAQKRSLDEEASASDEDTVNVGRAIADSEGEGEGEEGDDFLFPEDMPASDDEEEEEEEEGNDDVTEEKAEKGGEELSDEHRDFLEAEVEPEEDAEEEVEVYVSDDASDSADDEAAEDDDDDDEEEEEDETKESAVSASSPSLPLSSSVMKKTNGNITIGLLPLRRAERPPNMEKSASEKKEAKIWEIVSSDSDTSDDEHARNTVGRIPMEWYDGYEHIGYDLDGKKIGKTSKKRDRIEAFLNKVENENYSRTVYDPVTGKDIVLSDEDIAIIKRIQGGQFPNSNIDPYEDYVEWFTSDKMQTPLVGGTEPKRRFVPSKSEHKKIMKMVRAIRKGRMVTGPKKKSDEPEVYDLWADGQAEGKARLPPSMHMPAPKPALPGHEASYNPPPEFLPSQNQISKFKKKNADHRQAEFLPQKFDSLRHVPAYDRFVQERFHRCLDLYLCPRARRVRVEVEAESLLPKLPDPKDLQPFPTAVSLTYEGHQAAVTCLSVDPSGQWLATGSDDKSVRVWEIATGRCMKVIFCRGVVNSVKWSPNAAVSLLAAAVGPRVLLISPEVASTAIITNSESFCKGPAVPPQTESAKAVTWAKANESQQKRGIRLVITHSREIQQLAWHYKGTYLAAVLPGSSPDAVCIHSFIKQQTQLPFKKKSRDVQRVLFHPRQPIFFVASKTSVRVYNLQTQMLIKKLQTGVKWLSSIAVHPGGDNVIIGSFDRRLAWFDLDLSVKPYRTLRYHRYALRQVCFHISYPLFASCSDDGSIHVMHGMVYNDLLQNPLIVPVKILKGHEQTPTGLGVMDCVFHPRQPWLFSAGADGRVLLYT